MRAVTFLLLVISFDAAFPFYLELKPLSENILENQTIVKTSKTDPDAWRRRLILYNFASDSKNKDYPETSWGRAHDFPGEEKSESDIIGNSNGKQVDQSTHFPRDIRQDIRNYPEDWLAAWKNAVGLRLLKKTSNSDTKIDDTVPFWAARG